MLHTLAQVHIPVANSFIREWFQQSKRLLYIIPGTVNKKETFLGN